MMTACNSCILQRQCAPVGLASCSKRQGAGTPCRRLAYLQQPQRGLAQPVAALPAAQFSYMLAAAVDESPAWTLDQSVGLVFGFLLLGLYLSSSTLDNFVARSQRRQLGLCEECGGIYDSQTCAQKACPSKAKAQ